MANSPRPAGRTLKRLGLALMALGVVVAVASGIVLASRVGGPLVDGFSSDIYDTSSQTSVQLKADVRYEIMQEIGSGLRLSTGTVTIDPREVQVTGPDGSTIATRLSNGTYTVDRNGRSFVDAVEFDSAAAGVYRVSVAQPAATNFIVVRDVGKSFADNAGWAGLFGVGGLSFVAGLVLLLIGFGRARAHTSQVLIVYGKPAGTRPAMSYGQPELPPPGWYQDPQNPAGLRYWDGQHWRP